MTKPYATVGWYAAGIRKAGKAADRRVPPTDPVDRDPCSFCGVRSDFGCRHQRLERVLLRIEDPAARKIVIMAKRQRGEITDNETEHLIRAGGLEAA